MTLCLLILSTAVVLTSCRGGRTTESYVRNVIKAYGGDDRARSLSTFSGKGFIKQVPFVQVATNYQYDTYQKGTMIKNKVMEVRLGQLANVRILIDDGKERYSWTARGGRQPVSSDWDFNIIKYRFPYMLTWLQDTDIEGEVLEDAENGMRRMQYENGEDVVTWSLDGRSWVVRELSVTSKSDSSFSFREVYSDYRDVDGVPFPNRFSSFFGNRPYYEYLIPVINLEPDFTAETFTVTELDTTGIAEISTKQE